jgi:hypothetical protein
VDTASFWRKENEVEKLAVGSNPLQDTKTVIWEFPLPRTEIDLVHKTKQKTQETKNKYRIKVDS